MKHDYKEFNVKYIIHDCTTIVTWTSLTDYEIIVQQILDIPEVEEEIRRVPIYEFDRGLFLILGNGIVPSNCSLGKFGKKVTFQENRGIVFSQY